MWDIEATKEVGVRAAAVASGEAFIHADLEEAEPYAVYEDCAELLGEAGLQQPAPSGQEARLCWRVTEMTGSRG